MATTKSARLAHYDAQLKRLEELATKAQYHIDSDPDYIAVCAIVTDWDMGKRRFSPRLKQEIFNLHRAVSLRVDASYYFIRGVTWG